MTVSVEPEWSRVDDAGHVDSAFSVETRIIVDTELVPGTLYAAANAIYQPLKSRNFGAPAWMPSTNFGLAAALAYRLDPAVAPGPKQVVLGVELEYYRAHDTLGLASFSGDSSRSGRRFMFISTKRCLLRPPFRPKSPVAPSAIRIRSTSSISRATRRK